MASPDSIPGNIRYKNRPSGTATLAHPLTVTKGTRGTEETDSVVTQLLDPDYPVSYFVGLVLLAAEMLGAWNVLFSSLYIHQKHMMCTHILQRNVFIAMLWCIDLLFLMKFYSCGVCFDYTVGGCVCSHCDGSTQRTTQAQL